MYIKQFIIFVTILLTGCKVTTHKSFTFTSLTKNVDFGEVHIALDGSMKTINKSKSIQSSPYTLVISFSTIDKKTSGCTIKFDEIKLKNVNTNNILLINEPKQLIFSKNYKNEFTADLYYKDINIDYADYELNVLYSFDNECRSNHIPKPITVILERNYSERKITFWDTLMAI